MSTGKHYERAGNHLQSRNDSILKGEQLNRHYFKIDQLAGVLVLARG